MSDFIYSKVMMFGDSIEIMTPKHVDDAQHRHTIAYFEAFNELRRREADRVQEINSYIADQLRVPWKIHSRENPGGLTTGSSYMGNKRNWHPALPVQWWSPPKPVSDKVARKNADKVIKKAKDGDYVPRGDWSTPTAQRTPREAFTEITFEEIHS